MIKKVRMDVNLALENLNILGIYSYEQLENENNKLKILHSKLLEISKGEVLDTQIGSIKLLKNFEKPLKFRKYIWIEQEYYTGFSI